MTASAIGSLNALSNALAQTQAKGAASDGDSPSVEAAESPTVKLAEKTNGGIAPKGSTPTTYNATATTTNAPATSGSVNKLV